MTLVKRNGGRVWPELEAWDRIFDNIAGPMLRNAWDRTSIMFTPPVDISYNQEEIVLQAELPGVSREDLELTVHEDSLTIKGTKKAVANENQEGRYFYTERQHGDFFRSFQLPKPVNPDAVKADFQDGILTVRMPVAEQAKPRKIQIAVN